MTFILLEKVSTPPSGMPPAQLQPVDTPSLAGYERNSKPVVLTSVLHFYNFDCLTEKKCFLTAAKFTCKYFVHLTNNLQN